MGRGRLPLGPRTLVIAVLVLVGLAYGGYELYLRLTHVYEYDARVTADIVTISSRADGWVIEMPAREGMQVEAGQVVARIDDRVAKLRRDAFRAQIEGVRAERTRLRAERRLSLNQSEALARTRTATVHVREKALAAMKSDLDLAKLELERNRSLFASRVINERQLQVAQAAVDKLESQMQQLTAEQQQAQGSLEEAKVEQEKLTVIDAQIAALDHQVANLAAQMHQQDVDIEDRTIRSPVPAVIDRTFVLPGEYVQAGQRILLLHNPRRGLGRGQHQGDPGRPSQARPAGDRLGRRLSRRPLHRQGGAHRQRHHGALRPAADAQPVRQLHQDHPAHAGEDRHGRDAQAADARHDGRSRDRRSVSGRVPWRPVACSGRGDERRLHA